MTMSSPFGVLKKLRTAVTVPDEARMRGSLRFGYGLQDGVVEGVGAFRGAGDVIDFRALPSGDLRRQRGNPGARPPGQALRDLRDGDAAALDDDRRFDVAMPRGAVAEEGAVLELDALPLIVDRGIARLGSMRGRNRGE